MEKCIENTCIKKESPLHFQAALKKPLSNKRNSNIQCYSSLPSLFFFPFFNPLCTLHSCNFFSLLQSQPSRSFFFYFSSSFLCAFLFPFFCPSILCIVLLFRGQGSDLPEGSVAGPSACDAVEEPGTTVAASQRSPQWWDKEISPPVGRRAAFLL